MSGDPRAGQFALRGLAGDQRRVQSWSVDLRVVEDIVVADPSSPGAQLPLDGDQLDGRTSVGAGGRPGHFQRTTAPDATACSRFEPPVVAVERRGGLPAAVATVVNVTRLTAIGLFPRDGVATPTAMVRGLRSRAEAHGARFVSGFEVAGIERRAGLTDGPWVVISADDRRATADDVVVAVGVWEPKLIAGTGPQLPLFPVAHPYVYSAPTPRLRPGPFIRWPEHHVYAPVHENRLGIGSYDHAPVLVTAEQLDHGAGLSWRDPFDAVIGTAQQLLVPGARLARPQLAAP